MSGGDGLKCVGVEAGDDDVRIFLDEVLADLADPGDAHAPTGPLRGDEADPVRVVSGMVRGVSHQRADRVVAAQVPPDLRGCGLRFGEALVPLDR